MTHLGTPVDLFDHIVNQIRLTAPSVPTFENGGNGAIVIQVIPESNEANLWAQGHNLIAPEPTLSPDGYPEVSIRTQTYPILPKRDFVIPTADGPVDCSSYATMKIAHGRAAIAAGSTALHSGAAFESSDQYLEENGFANHHGAVCIQIGQRIPGQPCLGLGYGTNCRTEPFATIWVAVSGANQYEDERCAMSGISAVETWLESNSDGAYVVTGRHFQTCK